MPTLKGRVVLFPDDPATRIELPNNIPQEGQQAYLKMITQDAQADIAAGGNFYMGLKDASFDRTVGLAGITGEPTVTNGYARQAIVRSNLGWSDPVLINGIYRSNTVSVNFTAAGGNFSTSFSRAFLTNQAAGLIGKLLGVSAPLATPLLITNGTSIPMQYELYMA